MFNVCKVMYCSSEALLYCNENVDEQISNIEAMDFILPINILKV